MRRLYAIVVLVMWGGIATAQPRPGVAELEASGNKHYELAEYDAAITDFKEAFRISDEPAFLFNIAQAYRLDGDCREAATFYKNYLRRVPDVPNATKVRQRIREMEECADAGPVGPEDMAPPPPTVAPTAQQTKQPMEVADEPDAPTVRATTRGWMKWTGIVSVGAGALSAGLGIKFALDGKAANNDLARLCETSCSGSAAKSIEVDGKAANRNATIAVIAGGALIATGVVFLVLSGQEHSPAVEAPHVSVLFVRGGATAAYGWQF